LAIETPAPQRTAGSPARRTEGIVIREKPARAEANRGESCASLQRELVIRLNHLKTEARHTSEACLANVDSDVSTLIEFLDGSSEVRRPRDLEATTMDEWMKILDGLKLKPHKGRRKDLRRIDDAIRSMMRSAFE
jgi:hypothetical protein